MSFFSERLRLDGEIYLPDDLAEGEARPALVTCSGYQGLKDIHPARFGRQLSPLGYVCLAFDYRGFGHSEGERGRVVPQDQVEDIHNALTCLATRPEVDADRLGVIGWGMGGGLAVQVAAENERVRAVAVCNGLASGYRTTRDSHSDESWADLLARIDDDRIRRVTGGVSERVDPFDVLHLGGFTSEYVDAHLYPTVGFGGPVSLESADLMLRFRPELMAHLIAPRPVVVIHGTENELYRPTEATQLVDAIGPSARLEWLEGAGHTEFMHDDHPVFQHMLSLLVEFFGKHL